MPAVATERPPGALAGAGLVFAGGLVGTLARYGVGAALPVVGGWPLATLGVNLTGSFLLAALLGWLAAGPVRPAGGHRLRLLLGTGVIGGYTTYSALAVETERLLADGRPGVAAGYAAASLLGGLGAALVGHHLAARTVASPPGEGVA